jgi:hypothetical protein
MPQPTQPPVVTPTPNPDPVAQDMVIRETVTERRGPSGGLLLGLLFLAGAAFGGLVGGAFAVWLFATTYSPSADDLRASLPQPSVSATIPPQAEVPADANPPGTRPAEIVRDASIFIGDPRRFSSKQQARLINQAGRQGLAVEILIPRRTIESTTGRIAWNNQATFRRHLVRYNQQHATRPVRVIVHFSTRATWANQQHVTQFADFAAVVAGHYSTPANPAEISVGYHPNDHSRFGKNPAAFVRLYAATATQVHAVHNDVVVSIGPLGPTDRNTVSPSRFIQAAQAADLGITGGIWLDSSRSAGHQARLIERRLGDAAGNPPINVRFGTADPGTLSNSHAEWRERARTGTLGIKAPSRPFTVLSLDKTIAALT